MERQHTRTCGMQQKQFIAINTYIKRKILIKNLSIHLKELKKEKQTDLKVSRRKEMKIRAEINEQKNKRLTKLIAGPLKR